MNYKGLPDSLVARINPMDARGYAIASGWKRLAGVNGKVAVYNYPGSDLDQLIVPIDAGAPDYARRMAEVVANLAEKEGRPAREILNDLLIPPSDVLRFRLDEPATQSGLLPLDQGIDLLMGARKALLSAACSVVQPQPFHPRLSRTEAEQLVKSSVLGQTERGSFTAVISCPLEAGTESVVEKQTPLFPPQEVLDFDPAPPIQPMDAVKVPFTRQVTSLLMRSVARITSALDADDPDSLLNSHGIETPLSSNLCEALLIMQPVGERSRLSLAATWSRTLPPPPQGAPPSIVELRREYFPAIESLARKLRPAREPHVSYFVAMVDSLHGDPDQDGLVRGEVQLSILNQEETTKARVTLNPNEYQTALATHGVGGYVSLNGVLIRGDRVHRIAEVTNFKSLRD
jgi:hypothetical protein